MATDNRGYDAKIRHHTPGYNVCIGTETGRSTYYNFVSSVATDTDIYAGEVRGGNTNTLEVVPQGGCGILYNRIVINRIDAGLFQTDTEDVVFGKINATYG